jgi:hypothetical protein
VAQATARAVEVLRRTAPPETPGYRLFWVSGREVGFLDLPAGGAYAILGSHEQCDVVLRGDPRIALRHLLATTIELSDGIALRLLDLQTGEPFRLEDGAPRASIVACGTVVAQLARFVIGAVVAPVAGKLDLPEGLPPIAIEESRELPRSTHAPPTLVPPLKNASRAISYIASLPPLSSIDLASQVRARSADDEPPSIAAPRLAELGPYRAQPVVSITRDRSPPPAGHARVVLRHRGKSASVDLDRSALEAGVLIGRLPACPDPKLLDVLNGGISRGHVLLFRHHDACEAFDLCSTQGTFQGNARVRRVKLSPEGTHLQLASHEPVALSWSGG